MPDAAVLCPHLVSQDGLDNVFEQIGTNLFRIDSDENELCIFAYTENNKILCSLHTVALNHGLPIENVKPESCLLWPLAITEGKTRKLSMHEDAMAFSCNATNKNSSQVMCPNIGLIVESVFGRRFKNDLERAARQGQHHVKIHL